VRVESINSWLSNRAGDVITAVHLSAPNSIMFKIMKAMGGNEGRKSQINQSINQQNEQ